MDAVTALEWYAEQVGLCRKHGREGDVARAKLDRDAGYKAQQALEHMARPTPPVIEKDAI